MADEGTPKTEKKEKDSSEHINIKVVGSGGDEVFFKIKKNTQLKKLMEAYCDRQGKSMNSVRFLHDGERVQPTHTPADLDLDDGDMIEVMIQQTGGSN